MVNCAELRPRALELCGRRVDAVRDALLTRQAEILAAVNHPASPKPKDPELAALKAANEADRFVFFALLELCSLCD